MHFDIGEKFGPGEKRNVRGMEISNVGDLSISATGNTIAPLSEQLGKEIGVKVSDVNGSVYLRMGIKKAPGGSTEDGNIPDGANMFAGETLSSDNYEDGNSRYYNFTQKG